jgi:hypothetical protein
MKIEHLSRAFADHDFPEAGASRHPVRKSIIAARELVTEAIHDDAFLLNCAAAELAHIERTPPRRGLSPFYVDPHFGIRLAFGYWGPGSTPGPHEHTAWTITAVVRNELEVFTFDREVSYRQRALVPKNRFIAIAGQVGYVCGPIIHAPKNVSHGWTLSFHVTSPRDGEPCDDFPEPLSELAVRTPPQAERDHPYRYVRYARHRQNDLRELARLIATLRGPQARPLLERCAMLANAATRRRIRLVGEAAGYATEIQSSPIFVRAHPQLQIGFRENGQVITVTSQTENRQQDEFSISRIAREAIAFVINQRRFDVRLLPGALSLDERMFIAEALENTGLFREERQ